MCFDFHIFVRNIKRQNTVLELKPRISFWKYMAVYDQNVVTVFLFIFIIGGFVCAYNGDKAGAIGCFATVKVITAVMYFKWRQEMKEPRPDYYKAKAKKNGQTKST